VILKWHSPQVLSAFFPSIFKRCPSSLNVIGHLVVEPARLHWRLKATAWSISIKSATFSLTGDLEIAGRKFVKDSLGIET
jgi:hypothetical protein